MLGSNARVIADSYRVLATYTETGQPMTAALENLQTVLTGEERRTLGRIMFRIKNGDYMSQAMAKEGLPPLDIALIKVGEKSGTLTEIEKFLCQHYEERFEIERSIRRALFKPVALFVVAVFLSDFPAFFSGSLSLFRYLLKELTILGCVFIPIAALMRFYRKSQKTRAANDLWYKIFRSIPILGRAAETVVLERFFTCFSMSMRAGCDLNETIEVSVNMLPIPELRRSVSALIAKTQSTRLTDALASTGIFRPTQIMLIRTGEQSGQLDEAFLKICKDLREEVRFAIKTFEEWLPKILYGLYVAYTAYAIISSFNKYSNLESDDLKKLGL